MHKLFCTAKIISIFKQTQGAEKEQSMIVDVQFWLQMIIYAISFGVFYGTTTARLKTLEQKMDKHNSVMERVFRLEDSDKCTNRRISDLHNTLNATMKAGGDKRAG